MKIGKKALALCVTLALFLTAMTGGSPFGLGQRVLAAGETVSVDMADVTGSLQLKTQGGDNSYSTDGGSTWTVYTGTVTVTGTSTASKIIALDPADLIFAGVDIRLDSGIPVDLRGAGETRITLLGTNTLYTEAGAGIFVAPVSTLVVTDASTGALSVTGGAGSAGIGGGFRTDGGSVRIQGGSITATGGTYLNAGGAGIGSGAAYGVSCSFGSIEITGGTVNANGGVFAAGIGTGSSSGGVSNTMGTIEITGGTVTAVGESMADDMGTGYALSGATAQVAGVYFQGGSISADTVSPQPQVSGTDSTPVYPVKIALYGTEGDGPVTALTSTGVYGIGGMRAQNGRITLWLPDGTAVSGAAVGAQTYHLNTVTASSLGASGILYAYEESDRRVSPYSIFGGLLLKEEGGVKYYSPDNGSSWATYTGTLSVMEGTAAGRTIAVQSGSHSISLNGVELTAPAYKSALNILAGASLTLSLEGSSTLTGDPGYAGIHLPYGASLVIRDGAGAGVGSITAIGAVPPSGNMGGAGIGLHDWDETDEAATSAGTLTVESGQVTAQGGKFAAGIGGGRGGTDGGTVTVTGGIVKATGGTDAAGIGGGYRGAGGSVTVNGNAVVFAANANFSLPQTIGPGVEGAAGTVSLLKGIVFQGYNGYLYGAPVPAFDWAIPAGRTLIIEDGKTLEIPEGYTVTNSGSVAVKSGGTLLANQTGKGSVTGEIQYPHVEVPPSDTSDSLAGAMWLLVALGAAAFGAGAFALRKRRTGDSR